VTPQPEKSAPLTPDRAFVVQFRADTDLAADSIRGRVEHVVSGQARHFDSWEALLAFIARVLQAVDTQP